METGIGLLRDAVAATLGLAILFGAGFSDDQVAGVLLFVTTVGAVATWALKGYRSRKAPPVEPTTLSRPTT